MARIADWLSEATADCPPTELITSLRVTLCELLKMVSITLEAGDNAQVIFPTCSLNQLCLL